MTMIIMGMFTPANIINGIVLFVKTVINTKGK